MMRCGKLTVITLSSVAVLLATLGMSCAMKAVPKKQGKMYGPSKESSQTSQTSDYDRLLAKYLANIENLARQHQNRMIANWKARVEGFSQAANRAHLNESDTLEQLRAASLRRPGKKLTFDGMVEENSAFVPSSDVSARVFRRLYHEGLVRPEDLVVKLANTSDLLSNEWIPLLQDIANHSQTGTLPWGSSRFTLYRMGVSGKEYRADLEQMALEHHNASALRALVFETDKQTGEAKPIRNSESLTLINKAMKDPSNSPEALVVCAEYAAETSDVPQAERICINLLSQQYTLRESDTERDPTHRDYQLGRAKTRAMYIMFYKLRTPESFKAIYDLSRSSKLDSQNLLDKDVAQSFVRQVSECQ